MPLSGELQPLLPPPPEGSWHTPNNLPEDRRLSDGRRGHIIAPSHPLDHYRLCIVGAGVAGLYIAMILDSLKIPGLSYDILEGSDRVGGRLKSHYFSEKPHDYYDIGAMRFPKLEIMDRTFKLFKHLGVPLIPYYLNHGTVRCPSRYNDITVIEDDRPHEDIYRVGKSNGGSVPD
ncbi:MAG: hypothetical protein M1834_000044 [Cirrosporium novae-zelandiae]|nr:MAG: hypothetical protein M1834_000044 [Cirrosporium novae-zelandiae]